MAELSLFIVQKVFCPLLLNLLRARGVRLRCICNGEQCPVNFLYHLEKFCEIGSNRHRVLVGYLQAERNLLEDVARLLLSILCLCLTVLESL